MGFNCCQRKISPVVVKFRSIVCYILYMPLKTILLNSSCTVDFNVCPFFCTAHIYAAVDIYSCPGQHFWAITGVIVTFCLIFTIS